MCERAFSVNMPTQCAQCNSISIASKPLKNTIQRISYLSLLYIFFRVVAFLLPLLFNAVSFCFHCVQAQFCDLSRNYESKTNTISNILHIYAHTQSTNHVVIRTISRETSRNLFILMLSFDRLRSNTHFSI